MEQSKEEESSNDPPETRFLCRHQILMVSMISLDTDDTTSTVFDHRVYHDSTQSSQVVHKSEREEERKEKNERANPFLEEHAITQDQQRVAVGTGEVKITHLSCELLIHRSHASQMFGGNTQPLRGCRQKC